MWLRSKGDEIIYKYIILDVIDIKIFKMHFFYDL